MATQNHNWTPENSGDAAMTAMIIVAGLNFVSLRTAVSDLPPLAFNALRFALAAVVVLPLLLRRVGKMDIPRGDMVRYIVMSAVATTFFQAMLVLSVRYTTVSNSSLMMATGPAWTVLLTVAAGRARLSRRLLVGLVILFVGASLVVLAGGDGLGVSRDDLIGSGLMLAGAAVSAAYVVGIQRIMEHHRAIDMAALRHIALTTTMLVVASPQIGSLTPADFSWALAVPLVFSAFASMFGTFITSFAQPRIGATRMKVYDNLVPVAATLFAFGLLGESVVLVQLLGGALTLTGVLLVRRAATDTPTPRQAAAPAPTTAPATGD